MKIQIGETCSIGSRERVKRRIQDDTSSGKRDAVLPVAQRIRIEKLRMAFEARSLDLLSEVVDARTRRRKRNRPHPRFTVRTVPVA